MPSWHSGTCFHFYSFWILFWQTEQSSMFHSFLFIYLFFCRLRSENVVVETVLENVKLSILEQLELLIFFASSQLWWFADSEIFLRKVCPYFPKPKCHLCQSIWKNKLRSSLVPVWQHFRRFFHVTWCNMKSLRDSNFMNVVIWTIIFWRS